MKINFIQYLCTKVFHDFANLIGSVSNAVEFLGDQNPRIKEKVAELLKASATQLVTRLEVFRVLYGMRRSNMKFDLPKLKQLLYGFPGYNNAKFIIQTELQECDIMAVQAILAIVSANSSKMVNVVYIDIRSDGIYHIKMRFTGNELKFSQKSDILQLRSPDTVSIDNIYEEYATMILHELGVSLTTDISDKQIQYTVELKE